MNQPRITPPRLVVIVGAPLEPQRLYGPFDTHEQASEWCQRMRIGDYPWIVPLNPPAGIQGLVASNEVEE